MFSSNVFSEEFALSNLKAKRLNVKRPNTKDQRKWRQVQKPRKTGPQKRHHHDDSRGQKEHISFKKQRLTTEELENTIKDKIQKSKEFIAKLLISCSTFHSYAQMRCKRYHIIFSTFSLKFKCKICVQREVIHNFKNHSLVT